MRTNVSANEVSGAFDLAVAFDGPHATSSSYHQLRAYGAGRKTDRCPAQRRNRHAHRTGVHERAPSGPLHIGRPMRSTTPVPISSARTHAVARTTAEPHLRPVRTTVARGPGSGRTDSRRVRRRSTPCRSAEKASPVVSAGICMEVHVCRRLLVRKSSASHSPSRTQRLPPNVARRGRDPRCGEGLERPDDRRRRGGRYEYRWRRRRGRVRCQRASARRGRCRRHRAVRRRATADASRSPPATTNLRPTPKRPYRRRRSCCRVSAL